MCADTARTRSLGETQNDREVRWWCVNPARGWISQHPRAVACFVWFSSAVLREWTGIIMTASENFFALECFPSKVRDNEASVVSAGETARERES